MDTSAKKVMANLFYYTLAALIIAFSVLFIVALNTRAVATYQMVVYDIWAAVVILVVLADIWATMTNRSKYIIGLIVYGLTLLFIIVGFIVFAGLSTNGIVLAANVTIFNTLIYFSLGLTIALIVLYIVGLHTAKLNREE